MTFSLVGRCPQTGEIGAAVTTSDIAVGARVAYGAAEVGIAVTQHRTDPRLGPRLLELLRSGCSAQEAVDAAAASTVHRAWRQLAVMTPSGAVAAFCGDRVTPRSAAVPGADCLAVGNMLIGDAVAQAMVRRFEELTSESLAERLVRGLQAGEAAGGETGDLRSAAVLVYGSEVFPRVDLRVDADARPLRALAELWGRYRPWVDDFVLRAIAPDDATGQPAPRADEPTSTTT